MLWIHFLNLEDEVVFRSVESSVWCSSKTNLFVWISSTFVAAFVDIASHKIVVVSLNSSILIENVNSRGKWNYVYAWKWAYEISSQFIKTPLAIYFAVHFVGQIILQFTAPSCRGIWGCNIAPVSILFCLYSVFA